jgi:hypothetical protein
LFALSFVIPLFAHLFVIRRCLVSHSFALLFVIPQRSGGICFHHFGEAARAVSGRRSEAGFFCVFRPEIACQALKPLNSLKQKEIELAG